MLNIENPLHLIHYMVSKGWRVGQYHVRLDKIDSHIRFVTVSVFVLGMPYRGAPRANRNVTRSARRQTRKS